MTVYAVTLARGVTYWDAGEFLAAIHSLGIPHPPGTPLFVLAARVWSMLVAPFVGFTIAVNVFSAVCTAAACALLADLFYRWAKDALAAAAGAVCVGLTSTIWLNATETEVYAAALCVSAVILWLANKAHETGEGRWIVLLAYTCGLAWSLHLTALLVMPAVLFLIAGGKILSFVQPNGGMDGAPSVAQPEPKHRASPRSAPKGRLALSIAVIFVIVLGASAVLFMLVRARHDPVVNQGNPVTLGALWDAVQRHQYSVAPLWPRRAPWWIQVGNVLEYADWQFALGMAQEPQLAWGRTSVSVLFLVSGIYGSRVHRRIDRQTWRAMLVLLITTTLGTIIYLNLLPGPSIGYGILPDTMRHEARERDYFFVWAFACWALWAGYGGVQFARVYLKRWRYAVVVCAVCTAAVPLVLNWKAIRVERRDEQRKAERGGIMLLRALPPRAVFLAFGDNDTYPLWYLQEVRGLRRDVTVVTVPMLGPVWYRDELARRHQLLPREFVPHWFGLRATVEQIYKQSALQRRPVVKSPF